MSLLGHMLSGAGGAEVGNFSTTDAQAPSGFGDAGKIRVHFGVGGITTDGAIQVHPDGTIEQLIGRVYDMTLQLSMGRTGSAGGVSRLMGRSMVAMDGVEANAVQTGSTLSLEVDNANVIFEERIEFVTSLPGGALLWFELARDEGGVDEGEILTNQPSGTLAGWNISDTANLTIRTR